MRVVVGATVGQHILVMKVEGEGGEWVPAWPHMLQLVGLTPLRRECSGQKGKDK